MEDSLNDIHLSNQLITALFPRSMVELSHPSRSSNPPLVHHFKYLGNFEKRVALLVQSPGSTFLPEDELELLTKMIKACGLNLGDVAIINVASLQNVDRGNAAPVTDSKEPETAEMRLNSILSLSPEKIVSFGVTAPGSDYPLFAIVQWHTIPWLQAPSLKSLLIDSPEQLVMKSKIWSGLQRMFHSV